MVSKILAIIALVTLPLSVMLWYRSHSHPIRYRFDLTLYKSLDVYLRDGVCGLHLLSMPTKTALRTEFQTPLIYDAVPKQASFMLRSWLQGPYRHTWLVFPFWLSTVALSGLTLVPVVRGPMIRWWRRRRGRCLACGYNLTGNRSGRCPECGDRVITPALAGRKPVHPARGTNP